jgi:hypothetical protein
VWLRFTCIHHEAGRKMDSFSVMSLRMSISFFSSVFRVDFNLDRSENNKLEIKQNKSGKLSIL